MHLTFLLLCSTDASDVCAIKITYLLTCRECEKGKGRKGGRRGKECAAR